MKINYLLILMSCLIFSQCTLDRSKKDDFFELEILNKSGKSDTLLLTELITNDVFAKIPIRKDTSVLIATDEKKALSATLYSFDPRNFTLLISAPNERTQLSVDHSKIVSSSLADSIFSYINNSNNLTIGQFLSKGEGDTDILRSLFDSLVQKRQEILNREKNNLSHSSWELLSYQNQARAYSFLFYMGRNVLQLSPSDTFFSFVDKIDNINPYIRTLPNNLLYKYEINYLQEEDSIESIGSFTRYIENQTPNKDLASFLKAIYLKELTRDPSYWLRHKHLFNRIDLEEAQSSERNNPYYSLISKPISSYFNTLDRKPAEDFSMVDINGDTIHLFDRLNKIVVIDVWATWCGACISQKPEFNKIAREYADQVNFLSISIDQNQSKWSTYLKKKTTDQSNEFIVNGGFRSSFAQDYIIRSIPRYILISKEGVILNGDMPPPSEEMRNELEKHLQ